MIKACLWQHNTLQFGGRELLPAWQQDPDSRLWLDIVAGDAAADQQLLLSLGCHELAIQDAQRTRHPPKLEHFEEQCFIIYKGLVSSADQLDLDMLQIAFFVNERLLISYRHGTCIGLPFCWEHPRLKEWLASPALVLSRVLSESGRAFLEAVLATEKDLAEQEEAMARHPDDRLMHYLINYKTRLRKLLRTFTYHESITREILSDETSHIPMDDPLLRHSYKDVEDKFERLRTLCSLYYDVCGDLIGGYISLSSHRLNKTMQVLTVITAIFIPLGLMAGIYGMNFENMPELHTPHGYFYLLGAMATTAISLLVLFRRKHWI